MSANTRKLTAWPYGNLASCCVKEPQEEQMDTARLGCSTGVLRNKHQFFSRLRLVGRVQDSQTSLAFAVLQKGRAFDDAMLRCGLDTTLQFTVGFHRNQLACVVLVGAPCGSRVPCFCFI